MLTSALTAPDSETVPMEGIDGHPDMDYQMGLGEYGSSDDSSDESSDEITCQASAGTVLVGF